MPLHFAARMHAFVHGLFRPSDEAETRQLFNRVAAMFESHGLGDADARLDLVHEIAADVLTAFEIPQIHPQVAVAQRLADRFFDYENLFVMPEVDWSERRSVSEYWAIRDELKVQRALLEDFETTREIVTLALINFLDPVYRACPALLSNHEQSDGITIPTDLLRSIGDIGKVTETMCSTAFAEELERQDLLPRLRDRLGRNLVAASGGNPADPKGFNRAPKMPTQFDAKDPDALVNAYLGGTPLLEIFRQDVSFTIPISSRFEHHHIVAGSGHGKTQTLQYLISQDLEAMSGGNRTVIVLDSQGDLIRNISNLAVFAPGGALHDRIVIIDPTDVEWPVSLNLFDVGIERLQGYAPLERERLTNSILELYDFVLGSLLSAEMTQKQNVIFRYVTRLMLYIPDATIHTLRELMEPGSQVKFAADIAKLSGTAKHFFETEFAGREFEQTKKQVLRRLWGILENQTFERMFSHPRSKLDLFSEMNAGKVILINTAKDLLKETGTEIFGRFFIAMIAQAAQERATLPENRRTPTMVYIDEAADYFDRNIGLILAQARKYNVGMVLAHQYLGQLEPRLQEAFAANTSIKFAGGVSAKDARTLAPMLYCDPNLIESQPKGSFAAYVRGVTKSALPLGFPIGHLEKQPRMNKTERQELQREMRARYAVHYTELDGVTPKPDEPETDLNPEIEAQTETINEKSKKKPDAGGADTDAGVEL
ncbi:type IV secretory system conjugative DNA transfer family protein [Maritalea sp.]|uniref:type IV secretory system conjugative DNA transfer family protein n=1 Tax=Maritalea sp. TaxID=2003361 RepID=UPI003EF845B7